MMDDIEEFVRLAEERAERRSEIRQRLLQDDPYRSIEELEGLVEAHLSTPLTDN